MTVLEFSIQKQLRTNWCWAAVTVSIEEFFAPQSNLQQCGVAHRQLGLRFCEEPERKCNRPHKLDPPLEQIDRLRGKPQLGVLSFEEIKERIDSGLPFCVRIHWARGGGHFVVVVGYDQSPRGVNQDIVDDPLFLRSRVKYENFLTKYQIHHGRWTATFNLKGPRRPPPRSNDAVESAS